MMQAYDQRCAYLAMHIEQTGNPTVDHAIPKSLAWNLVYEWSNYRLCAGVVNSKKGELLKLVDPISIKVGWFSLDLSTFRRGLGAGGIDLPYLERRAPFIAGELRRQGQLVRGDA